MYLSKLLFDPLKRQVRKELANRYELHRTLYAQFDGINKSDVGLLYRVEMGNPNQMEPILMLVQTQVEPDWQAMFEQGLLVENAAVKQYKPVFTNGDIYHFKLLANPTVRRKEGGYAGKRVALLTEEEQVGWLQRKARDSGFELLQLSHSDQGKLLSRKIADGAEMTLTHQAVLYVGALAVRDNTAFLQAYKKGIGSGKAFGFGLLSLARA